MKKIPVRELRTNLEPELTENFSIREVSQILSGKSMSQELHRHDHYFILVLSKGKGVHEIDFKEYKICNNSVFILRPGQVHKLTLRAGSIGYILQFNKSFYSYKEKTSAQLLRFAVTMNFCPAAAPASKRLFNILDTISREFSEKKEGYKEIIKAELSVFFIELMRQRTNNSTPESSLYNQQKIDELFELLDNHITNYKHVSKYAVLMKLTIYQLNALTKASLGKTCSELIDEHIILESKRNLLAASDQVGQIAYLLGYEDASYFIRFFKKHTGYTPGAFREKFI